MIHLQRFIDRVQGNESRGLKDLNLSMTEARAMHAELTRLLLEIQQLREQAVRPAPVDDQVITVNMDGGSF